MKTAPQNGQPDITLHDVMAHLQLHLELMREEFKKVHTRIDGLEKKVDFLVEKVDRIDHRLIIVETKIDNIGDRLDDIEVFPSIVKHLRTKR